MTAALNLFISAAVNFSTIGKMQAKGNSFDAANYQYLDELSDADVANNTTLYYRLKEVDKDGTDSYSQLIAIDAQTNLTGSIVLYPTPSKDFLSIASYPLTSKEIEVKDLLGRDIYRQAVTANQTTIDIRFLPQGIYFTIIKDEKGSTVSGKFVKE